MANLLIIDDDNDILRLLEFTLKRAGHHVTICSDGLQGLSQAEARKPDLIVCDVMMPRMTGYDFCRQVRVKPALRKVPIIVYSARFQPVDKETALEAGATDYLPKSISPDDLVHRIAELLPAGPTPTAQGTIGLFSIKGGVGVTTLAVNLALASQLSRKTRTVLVDLALFGGHAALMLGLRPDQGVVQLLSTAKNSLSFDLIRPHLLQHRSGLQLLALPPTFDPALALDDQHLVRLIKSLTSHFAVTILDLPQLLEADLSPALPQVDKLLLVLSPDMPSVQSTAIALQGLVKEGVTSDKIILVVNQITPYNTLPVATLQKILKRPVTALIPFEAEMVKAANSGQPLIVSQPQSPASAAINKLAGTIFA